MKNINDYLNSTNTVKFQATSDKPQALKKLIKKISKEDIINETVPHNDIEEAQATSLKHQASKASSGKPQAPSCKPQASSREQQAAQSRYPHKVSSN